MLGPILPFLSAVLGDIKQMRKQRYSKGGRMRHGFSASCLNLLVYQCFWACTVSPFAYSLFKPLSAGALLNTLQMAVSFYFRLERYSWSLLWLRHETRVFLFLYSQREASSMPLWSYVEYTNWQQTLASGHLQMYFIQHHASILRSLVAAQYLQQVIVAITFLQGLHHSSF